MEHYLLIARSVTQAQEMKAVLAEAGIRVRVSRAPMELTEGRGCAYAVRVGQSALYRAVSVLSGAGERPLQIFVSTPEGYREVAL